MCILGPLFIYFYSFGINKLGITWKYSNLRTLWNWNCKTEINTKMSNLIMRFWGVELEDCGPPNVRGRYPSEPRSRVYPTLGRGLEKRYNLRTVGRFISQSISIENILYLEMYFNLREPCCSMPCAISLNHLEQKIILGPSEKPFSM